MYASEARIRIVMWKFIKGFIILEKASGSSLSNEGRRPIKVYRQDKDCGGVQALHGRSS